MNYFKRRLATIQALPQQPSPYQAVEHVAFHRLSRTDQLQRARTTVVQERTLRHLQPDRVIITYSGTVALQWTLLDDIAYSMAVGTLRRVNALAHTRYVLATVPFDQPKADYTVSEAMHTHGGEAAQLYFRLLALVTYRYDGCRGVERSHWLQWG